MKGGFLKADARLEMYQEWYMAALYIKLHNGLKSYLPRKISKFTLCILKREGGSNTDHQTANTIQLFLAIKRNFSDLFFF